MAKERIRILYIDDEVNNLNAFKASFRRQYEIYLATNTLDARKIIQNINLHIIIADQRMPGITGVQFFNAIKENYPDPIRILLTAHTDIEALIDAINKGQIYRFIRKPWDDYELQNTISNAYEIYNTKKELEDKMEELEKANNELSRFIYSASHDLRSPLMSVLGIVNLAKMEQSVVDPNGYLTMIESSILRLDDFLQKIIEYYKNARLDTDYEKINFKSLVCECVNALKDAKDQINFNIDIEQDSIFYGDVFRISIILNNLISNAIKYQKNDNPEPKVSVKIRSDDISSSIDIEDNGIGIPAEHLNNIFKMFFRTSGVNKSGTGIGLYIVREALNRIGGTIKVVSAYGKGTTFIITIPNKNEKGA